MPDFFLEGLRIMRLFLSFFFLIFLSACSSSEETDEIIRVGTISGPETQLMQVVQNVALKNSGLTIKIIEFNEYNAANEALMKGTIDVNMIQHQPFLITWNAEHNGNLIPIAPTFIYPMGIYSYKVNHLNELEKNSVIAIPSDPTNRARALLLIQKAGLIQLREGADVLATPADIISNPLDLQFQERAASQLPKLLSNVDAAAINSNYALTAGLLPTIDDNMNSYYALYLENKDALYANILAIRPSEKNNPELKQLISAFHSQQVLTAAQAIFRGGAIKAWE
jgi:D-methionine transport system substrate-binding protein